MADSDDDLFGAEHVRAYRASGGKHGYHWRGTTVLLLTTTGRNSGEQRTTPLIHVTDDGRWVVIASKGGAPDDPDWFKNLAVNPEIEIQVADEVIPVVAEVVEGDERERLWKAMVATWPDYDNYQQQTDRRIPVVALSRR